MFNIALDRNGVFSGNPMDLIVIDRALIIKTIFKNNKNFRFRNKFTLEKC